MSKRYRTAVGMLSQWLNEDRIKDGKHFVSNEDIHHWLDESVNHIIQQAELRGRIDEWATMGDYLTEADKRVVSRSFMDMYRIHGEGLQAKLDQLKDSLSD